jgi:CcmD family protein
LGAHELEDVAAVFAAFLVVISGYVLMLDARGRRLRKELDRVRKMVDGPEKRG